MACRYAEKCVHFNAWWCDVSHASCGVANKFENAETAPDASEKSENTADTKAKGGRQNRKKGGA